MAIRETTENAAGFDDLIGGTAVTAIMHNINIVAGTAMARGSVLTGEGTVVTAADEAEYVLAADVAETDTVATVFVSGMFNREKLIVGADDTVDTHEKQLRDKNIYLTSIKE